MVHNAVATTIYTSDDTSIGFKVSNGGFPKVDTAPNKIAARSAHM